MVQVDVFWAYAIGASFALAAHRQLRLQAPPGAEDFVGLLENKYFTSALLYLALLFAPSGIILLWSFPSWETMHVGDHSLPGWLVGLFALTNISQGILGFVLTRALIRRDRLKAAYLQPILGYFLMFFILVHGWDGTGYQRFFSATAADFAAWTPAAITAWLSSDVALTLAAMGVFIIPGLLLPQSRWLAEARGESRLKIAGLLLAAIFAFGLGGAILASLMVHALGWGLGGAGFIALAAGALAGPLEVSRPLRDPLLATS